MRSALIVTAIAVGLECGSGWAQDATPADLGQMPCKAVSASIGTSFFADVQAAVVSKFNKLGEGEHFGSDCNMADYVLKVCRLHPRFSLDQSIADLVRLRRAGAPLPRIAMCGA